MKRDTGIIARAAAALAMAFVAAFGVAGRAVAQNEVGLGASVSPGYEGGKEYRVRPLPLINYRNGSLFVSSDGSLPRVGLRMPLGSQWSAGVFAGMRTGREASDYDRLDGMDDIHFHATYGGFLNWENERWNVGTTVTQAARQGYGTRAELSASYMLWRGGAHTVRVGASTQWGSHDDMETWFGVSRAESLRSNGNLRDYSAGAGFRSATAFVSWRYALGGQWSVQSTLGLRTLFGDAADSPIVERKTAAFGAVGLVYRF